MAEDTGDLHEAARAGDLARVRSLLDGGADIEARGGLGDSPLHEAAMGGHHEVVSLLLDRGADPNARDKQGRTPLLAAAFFSGVAAVLAKQGRPPLFQAEHKDYFEVIRLLRERGADPNDIVAIEAPFVGTH